jgi:hypothetical protein
MSDKQIVFENSQIRRYFHEENEVWYLMKILTRYKEKNII